ncbi:hypothetical protein [Candidatus Mycoplasma haematominutum]|uniref:Uncharacterized protein n=1 Tax=Candidatus Mycoplasma haematominutum 'Birmingham 1' TaxID=1116213 RepID=G8C3C5_9MOLU|nr:hypothetical protein [Candidatus Mycoplasma haematominutum]CCE66823.1 hypothetical protein MHM_03050 [Candidatus Mycoplasma haematominutum 'Birmingham 1']
MVFTKYLFTTIAGLTGGVNALVFNSSGGATIGQEIQDFEREISDSDDSNSDLITRECDRLNREKVEAEKNFSQLNDQNESTKAKSRQRRSAGEELTRENYQLDRQARESNQSLESKQKELQEKLNSDTKSASEKVQEKVQKLFQALKTSVDRENEKLSEALKNLTESNQKLIEKVKNCINELPQSIFVDPKKLENKSYCDYVEEQRQAKDSNSS